MSFIRQAIVFSTLPFVLLACNGGGITTPPGTQCGKDYNPVPMKKDLSKDQLAKLVSLNKDENSKVIANSPKDTPALRPGTYTYKSADLFYKDNNPSSPFVINIQDVNNPTTGTSKASVVCVRNAKTFRTPLTIEGDTVSDIIVDPKDLSMKVNTRHFSFVLHDNANSKPVDLPASQKSDKILDSPDKAFTKGDLDSHFLIQTGDNEFELHSQYPTPDGGTLYISLHMTYVKSPLTATTVKPPH